ncbi:hypothetical protein KBD45_07365 [Candidatus Dojkabacteria bacterium]|nr:hypothetical protein [Candidatus Dojkabacteria bacterium]
MHKRLYFIQIFIFVAFILSGCSALTSSQEEVIPPGIIDPSKNITLTPTQAEKEIIKGNIIIDSINVSKAEVYEGIEVELSGKYPDTCTTDVYTWKLEETNVIIEVGQKDDNIECKQIDKPFNYTIPIRYTFKPNQQYTVIVNKFQSKPFRM